MLEALGWLTLGVGIGLVYGVLALGIVLVYKGTKIINFAHPFMGLVTSFVCDSSVPTDQPGNCGPDNAIASLSAEEDRTLVDLGQMSQHLINAVISTEDRDFFQHSGVDPVGITRAAVADVRGSSQQGGSTITQQYVKNVFLTSERTITRKLKEAVLAVKLERELEKDEILERYLNTIYFGRGSYGAASASRAYFGVDVGSLNVAQAAYLAGLIRAPEAADASRDPEEAKRRRTVTLSAMHEEGYITTEELDAANAVPMDNTAIKERTAKDGLGNVKYGECGSEYYVE